MRYGIEVTAQTTMFITLLKAKRSFLVACLRFRAKRTSRSEYSWIAKINIVFLTFGEHLISPAEEKPQNSLMPQAGAKWLQSQTQTGSLLI